MDSCNHSKRKCLNHFDTFRKYLCDSCKGVFICECEKEMVSTLFPHQKSSGSEYGTREKYKVNGFTKICAKCRGEKEEPHPRAQIYGQKKKLHRYYWREISFFEYKKILELVKKKDIKINNIFDFEKKFPEQKKEFQKEAINYWREEHKKNPLYKYANENREGFLDRSNIPVIELKAKKIVKNNNSYWLTEDGDELTSEEYVARYYGKKGYSAYSCERKIVSTLIGAFLWTPINSPDEKLRICGLGSKGKLSKMNKSDFNEHGVTFFNLPQDFGSHEFYLRKKDEILDWISSIESSGRLIDQYDYFLKRSEKLRDYLWVYNDEAEDITRIFLKVVPDGITLRIIEWAIEHFWERQPGWPDLFVINDTEYFFVEVKGPNDRLSPDQINWFEWVKKNNLFNCYVCKLKVRK